METESQGEDFISKVCLFVILFPVPRGPGMEIRESDLRPKRDALLFCNQSGLNSNNPVNDLEVFL